MTHRMGRTARYDAVADLYQLESAVAAERAEPLGIDYVHGSCSHAETLAGARFDVVVCHHRLADIDDLDGCLATVARVLEPGGRFSFSMLHPCFPGWGDDVSAEAATVPVFLIVRCVRINARH